MKRFPRTAWIAILVPAALAVWAASVFYARCRDYGEAEPLVPFVWEMGPEMQRFTAEKARLPASLDELAAFAPELKLARLRPYPHQFSPDGPYRFRLHVNGRHDLALNSEYFPEWVEPGQAGALTTPAK